MNNNTGQTVELHYPDKKALKDWYQLLSYRNKNDLEFMAAPLRKMLKNKGFSVIDQKGKQRTPTEITDFIDGKGNIRKEVIVNFLCFMLADIRNFICYLNSLTEKDRKVWQVTLNQYYIDVDEIYQLTGHHWFPKNPNGFYSYYYNLSDISDKLVWFSIIDAKGKKREGEYFWSRDFYCRPSERLHSELLPVFFPEACDLGKQLLEKLPEKASLHTFSGEADILMILPALNGIYETKQLLMLKDKFSLTTVRKLSASVPLNEFFPDHEVKELALFRSTIVLTFYALAREMISLPNRPEDALKQIFCRILYYPTTTLPVLLPHLTGLRRNELLDSYGAQLGLALWNLLSLLPSDKWIPAQGIHFKLIQTATHYVPLFSAQGFNKMDVYNDKLGHTVYLNRLYHEVSVPFINGLLYAMAALGFVEVAYADVTDADASYTSSLAYVRLTPLGAYALEQTKEYVATTSQQEQGPLFELDGQHMIVRSLASPNPYLPLLTEAAVPIGGNRYRVNAGSFLNNCQGKEDIKHKIDLFKQYICPEPSAEWENFFQGLLQHSCAITPVKEPEYIPYRIDPEDKELQRIVSTDPVIREYSLRAEGYLWLIEANKLKVIQKRLKECGYLF